MLVKDKDLKETKEINELNKFYSNKALHKLLTNSIIGGHLCHAYLFYGQKSVGKRTLAKNFAMSVFCTAEEKPCYKCKGCQKVITKNHPDLYIYEGKEGRAAIHIETIRDIRQDAYIRPNDSEYKIYIIPNAQDMSISAANAFLKILEAPPPHAIFILTAVSKQAVPETVLSRCISFELFPMTIDEELEALDEFFPEKKQDELLKYAELSNGFLGRAIDFLIDAGYNITIELAQNAAKAIASKREYDLLGAMTKANSSRGGMLELIEELNAIIRSAILVKLKVKTSFNELTENLSYTTTIGQLNDILELLQEAKQGIESNVNMTLLANNLTAQIITALLK